ncbi:hypothetical protein Ae201684P_006537 [Aphanomyces euteiches]|uniref:Uncharacterized protein n=1 Tax=Aphanomyces euteiches TaxID=100861 RepID=A0A6G0XBN4_9STRA|nr:hypothetical protein Ae201684_006660 [Aphanomyces euteiches]KAH9091137.1 hypothetical protein Ae201684P_006537 [Aphanomyces euteiches]
MKCVDRSLTRITSLEFAHAGRWRRRDLSRGFGDGLRRCRRSHEAPRDLKTPRVDVGGRRARRRPASGTSAGDTSTKTRSIDTEDRTVLLSRLRRIPRVV